MRYLGLLLAILSTTAHSGEPRTFYIRAQVERATSGTIVVTSQYEPLLDLPNAECRDGEFTCVRQQQYGQLYRFDFFLTQFNKSAAGQDVASETSAGTVYLATDMDKAQEIRFEESVDASIAFLHGDSFRHAYAGWGMGHPPFVQDNLLGSSHQSAWFCQEHGDTEKEWRVTPQIHDGKVVGVTNATSIEPVAGKVCEALRSTRAPEGRSTTTPLGIESLVRTDIEVTTDWYRGNPDLGSFQPLPEEMEYSKTEVDHQHHGGSMGIKDGILSMEETENGVKRKLRLGPFEIEPPRPHSAAWVTRWTVSTIVQTFGEDAAEELHDRQEIWIVTLPLDDPLAAANAPLPGDPGEAVFHPMIGSLDRAARLNKEIIAAAFQDGAASSLEGDWMLVYCPVGDAPKYSIAGFRTRVAIHNGDDFCDAVWGLYARN